MPDKHISANRQVAFECRTIGSRPRPLITWWLDGAKIDPTSESDSVDGNVTIDRAIFLFKPSDNNKFFSCRVENLNLEDSLMEDGVVLVIYCK